MVAVQALREEALLAQGAVVEALALQEQEQEADREARVLPPVLAAPQLEAALRPAPSAAGPPLELSVVELLDPRRRLPRPPHLSLLQPRQAKILRPAAG